MKTTIVCRLQVEGVHQWTKCPFEQVRFLRDEHRHIFFIECETYLKIPKKFQNFKLDKNS